MSERNRRGAASFAEAEPATQSVSSTAQILVGDNRGLTERTVLRTLFRCGVQGDEALRTLAVVERLIALLREAGEAHRFVIRVTADPTNVRVDLDLTAQLGALPPLVRGLANQSNRAFESQARRWGIVREGRRTALWVEPAAGTTMSNAFSETSQ